MVRRNRKDLNSNKTKLVVLFDHRLLTDGSLRLQFGIGVGKILRTPNPTPVKETDSNSGLDSGSEALLGPILMTYRDQQPGFVT